MNRAVINNFRCGTPIKGVYTLTLKVLFHGYDNDQPAGIQPMEYRCTSNLDLQHWLTIWGHFKVTNVTRSPAVTGMDRPFRDLDLAFSRVEETQKLKFELILVVMDGRRCSKHLVSLLTNVQSPKWKNWRNSNLKFRINLWLLRMLWTADGVQDTPYCWQICKVSSETRRTAPAVTKATPQV